MGTRRAYAGAVVVLAAVLAVAATAAEIGLSIEADIAGDTLTVRGRADVADGAWINFAAYRGAPPARRLDGAVRVSAGRFTVRRNVADWPAGPIHVDVHFQMLLRGRAQPAAAVARFGPKGEYMSGPNVVEGGEGYRAAVASAVVVKD